MMVNVSRQARHGTRASAHASTWRALSDDRPRSQEPIDQMRKPNGTSTDTSRAKGANPAKIEKSQNRRLAQAQSATKMNACGANSVVSWVTVMTKPGQRAMANGAHRGRLATRARQTDIAPATPTAARLTSTSIAGTNFGLPPNEKIHTNNG